MVWLEPAGGWLPGALGAGGKTTTGPTLHCTVYVITSWITYDIVMAWDKGYGLRETPQLKENLVKSLGNG